MRAQLFTLGVFLCLFNHADFAGKFAASQGAQAADESAHTAEILCVRRFLHGGGSSSGAKDASWTSLAVSVATTGRETAPTADCNHGDASVEVHYLSGDEQGRLYPLSLVWRTLETSCGTKPAVGLRREPAVDEAAAVTAEITEADSTKASLMSGPQAEDGKIQELLGALRSAFGQQAMPPAVAEAMAKMEVDQGRVLTRTLHTQTTQLGAAKKQLQETRVNRRVQEQAWADFLNSTVAALEKGAKKYQELMEEFDATEAEALQRVAQARKCIRDLANSEKVTKEEEEDEESDLELMTDVAGAASSAGAEENPVEQAQKKLRVTMDALLAKMPATDAGTPRRRSRTEEPSSKPEAVSAEGAWPSSDFFWHSVMEEPDFLSVFEAKLIADLWATCVALQDADPRQAAALASSRGSPLFQARWNEEEPGPAEGEACDLPGPGLLSLQDRKSGSTPVLPLERAHRSVGQTRDTERQDGSASIVTTFPSMPTQSSEAQLGVQPVFSFPGVRPFCPNTSRLRLQSCQADSMSSRKGAGLRVRFQEPLCEVVNIPNRSRCLRSAQTPPCVQLQPQPANYASPPDFQPAPLHEAGAVQHGPTTAKARLGPRRPSMLSYTLASQIELLPTDLTGPLPDLPVDELQAVIASPQASDAGRYTVCEPRQNVFHRNAGPHWSPHDYLADSASSVHYVVRQARFHRQPLPSLALPQVVLTPLWAEPGHQAVVVDLRPNGGGLCTVLAGPATTDLQIAGLVTAQGCNVPGQLAARLLRGELVLRAEDGRIVRRLEELVPPVDWLYFGVPDPAARNAQRRDEVLNDPAADEGEEMVGIQVYAAAPIGQPPRPFRFPSPCEYVPVDCLAPCCRKVGTVSEPTADPPFRTCAHAPQPRSRKVGTLSEPTAGHSRATNQTSCPDERTPTAAFGALPCLLTSHWKVGTLSEPTVGDGRQTPPKVEADLAPSLAPPGFPSPVLPLHPRAYPGDPPSLLAAGSALRPELSAKFAEGDLQILPSFLHSQGRLTLSAAQLRLCQDATLEGTGAGKYSVFDRHRHHDVRKSIPTWAASDYLHDAIASCAEATICAQFLQPPIPDLPVPQITLTPPGWPLGSLAVAVDTRKVGGTICTVVLTPGCEKITVLDAIATECPTLAPVLNFAVAQDAVFLLDSAGRICDVLPLQLDTLQWLSLQLDVAGTPALHSSIFQGGMFGPEPTTLTSTAAVASSSTSTPPTVTFILVGGGTLIRLAPQPWMHASVLDSLTELLFVLALQGRMPHRPMLQISAASPRVPARLNTYFICFLIYPEGPDIHVLEDFSVDGSLLQGFSVDAGTRPVHLLSEAHARRGFAAYINGLAHTAANRELATGDLIQIRQGDYFAEVETPSRLYELLPQLRYFALPVPVPHMQALAADPLSATLQVRCKEALKRTLQLRIDDRQRHFGTFARGNQPIVVLGPGHPALSLYMDQPLTPGFAEAVEFLQNGEYLPAGTTFRDPLVLEWTTPVFISVPPGSTRRTLLYPSPHSPHFLQVSVPPNLPLAGLPLPVRRGKRAVFPPETESEHVIEEKPLPQDRRGSADTSGTSFLQTSAKLRRVHIPTPLGRRVLQAPLDEAAQSTTDRTILKLACTVPPPEAGAAWGVNGDIAVDAFSAHSMPLPDLVPRARGLLSSARRTWNLLDPPCSAEHLDAVLIYTDGSYDPKAHRASWSFVAVGARGPVLCRLGALAGQVPEPASTVNAFRAELWALLHAAAFAIANHLRQVTFAVDCQAALDVAFGRAQAAADDPIGLAVQSLFFFARTQGLQVKPWKVEAHSGVPLNEAADAVAKTANGCWVADGFKFDDSVLRSSIDDGTIHRLWLTSSTGRFAAQLPPLDHSGCWNLPSCQLLPTTEATTSSISSAASARTAWRIAFSAITYNCLSARSKPARALLDAGLQASQCAIAGLQEARDPNTGISASDHFWIATSGCDAQGSYGCQLWISKNRAWGHSADTALKPVRDSFSLFHAEPRLLVLLFRVGRVKFACASAHAPTTAAGAAASKSWWDHVRATCNRIPPGHTLLFLVDANAAFDRCGGSGDTLASVPTSENAKQLQQFCDATSLQPTAQVDRLGQRLVSWTSPDGQTQKLLDYVCVPAAWRSRLSTAPNFCLGDLREGYDHSPIMGSVVATVCAPCPNPRPRISAEALRTPIGQQIAAAALASAPQVPWEVDATTHLEVLLGHVQRFLARHLPPPPPKPRNPVLSDLSLRLVLTRRQVRTVHQRLTKAYARGLLFQCFAAWSGRGEQARSQAHRLDRLSCRLARAGFALSAGIGKSFRADKAQFTRRAMETARGQGPAEFAHSIRAILRNGRRFRAPQLLHQISDGASTASCEEEILALLGEHFAKPERARQTSGGELAALFNEVQPPVCKVDMTSLPSVAEIASATLALKKGKAPGVSGVPAELFQADAMATAALLFPILAKSVMRCSGPLQHNGGLARAIPKSKQQAGTPAGWRSILLLEPTGKILQKAYRTQLVLALEQHKSKNQFGGLPRRRLDDASVMVRAHFARLKAGRQTGGALFIDSRAAYYSLVRDSLIRSQTLQTEAQLYQRARALFPFRDDQAPYVSGSGAAPGSPIADLLFSFVYARFLQHVEEILMTEGHYVAICSTTDAAIMPTWADDTAVLVGPVAPPLLAASLQRVTDLVTRGLSRAGLDPNFGPGKTEAVIHFEGPGSRDTRRQLLCLAEPGVPFDSHLRGTQHLRLVPTYVHLGTVVSHNLSEEPNLQHRAHLLKQLFQPLRRRLLYNEDLMKHEKVRLLEERVLPKFLFGAGFWTPRNTREHDMTLDPLRCAMRQAFRPITGVSSTGFSNQEVAAALGLPTAEDCLAHARAVTLLHLLKTGSREVWQGLLADGLWYQLSWEALRKVSGEAWPVALCTTAPPSPEQLLSCLPSHCDRICRNYLRTCKHNLATVVLQPRCADASEMPAIVQTVHPRLAYTCDVCGVSFLDARRLAVHKARKHQQRAIGLRLAWGTRCERCGTEFWNTSRLAQHLQRSAGGCDVQTLCKFGIER
ncbi:unnamed protein product, partial [Symbiodinium sp. KB8]